MQHLNYNHPNYVSVHMESIRIGFTIPVNFYWQVFFFYFSTVTFHKAKVTLKNWFGQHFINSEI
jgi:hypothetical protein